MTRNQDRRKSGGDREVATLRFVGARMLAAWHLPPWYLLRYTQR